MHFAHSIQLDTRSHNFAWYLLKLDHLTFKFNTSTEDALTRDIEMGAVAVGYPPDVVVPVEILRVRVELKVVLAKLETGKAEHHRLRYPVGSYFYQLIAALQRNAIWMPRTNAFSTVPYRPYLTRCRLLLACSRLEMADPF